jgi:hypothetical protein
MPKTRLERSLALLGIVAIAGLLAILVYEVRAGPGRTSPQRSLLARDTAPAPESHRRGRTSVPQVRRRQPVLAVLKLTAARGDCWLSIHVGSPDGKVLYTNVLTQGNSVQVKARRLWIEYGAAENLDVTLNGKSTFLGEGTGTALVTPRGPRRTQQPA